MIITRTPYRVSFFGGGTDYPAWYQKHGGAVLSATINKYCYLTVRYLPPFFEHRYRIIYRKIEMCNDVGEIEHPAVRACLEHLGTKRGLEIHHDGDLPARSGMGTSSSFTVGLMHALYALGGRMISKQELARESIYIEQDVLHETVGSQDQVAVAYGGLNLIVFGQGGEISVRPITLSPRRIGDLGDHLMLFYTGIKRTASEIAGSYVSDIEKKRTQLRVLRDLVDEAMAVLARDAPLTAFGELLHEAWQVKRELSIKVSSSQVDQIYTAARQAGASGGKLTGAGGGGFLLLFVPPDRQASVRQALTDLLLVPIRFEFEGSQVVLFDLDEDYAALDGPRPARTGRAAPRTIEAEGGGKPAQGPSA
ncbi:MAG: kinase [Planctomycetes bacterium]|nr:kinase [Planctomycetota bacterium]